MPSSVYFSQSLYNFILDILEEFSACSMDSEIGISLPVISSESKFLTLFFKGASNDVYIWTVTLVSLSCSCWTRSGELRKGPVFSLSHSNSSIGENLFHSGMRTMFLSFSYHSGEINKQSFCFLFKTKKESSSLSLKMFNIFFKVLFFPSLRLGQSQTGNPVVGDASSL